MQEVVFINPINEDDKKMLNQKLSKGWKVVNAISVAQHVAIDSQASVRYSKHSLVNRGAVIFAFVLEKEAND